MLHWNLVNFHWLICFRVVKLQVLVSHHRFTHTHCNVIHNKYTRIQPLLRFGNCSLYGLLWLSCEFIQISFRILSSATMGPGIFFEWVRLVDSTTNLCLVLLNQYSVLLENAFVSCRLCRYIWLLLLTS